MIAFRGGLVGALILYEIFATRRIEFDWRQLVRTRWVTWTPRTSLLRWGRTSGSTSPHRVRCPPRWKRSGRQCGRRTCIWWCGLQLSRRRAELLISPALAIIVFVCSRYIWFRSFDSGWEKEGGLLSTVFDLHSFLVSQLVLLWSVSAHAFPVGIFGFSQSGYSRWGEEMGVRDK